METPVELPKDPTPPSEKPPAKRAPRHKRKAGIKATIPAEILPPVLPPAAPKKSVWRFINTNSGVLDLIVNTLTFFIVACFGTWLVFRQNNLMENQNALIKQQMSLDEAGRRGALITLMSNIMDKVDDEIKEQQAGLSKKERVSRRYFLSESLIGQIAALSHSFKPYRYLDADTLIARPLSPERGQLLITLIHLPLDTACFNQIYRSSTFEDADLKSADLERARLDSIKLNRANLMKADLRRADLRGADLKRALLEQADLTDADLRGADLKVADFTRADLRGANFMVADLREAYFIDADLMRVDLRGKNLTDADLTRANLRDANLTAVNLTRVNLTGANLTGTNLRYTDLTGADLSIHQASETQSFYKCTNLHDSIKSVLEKTHPQLFKEPEH